MTDRTQPPVLVRFTDADGVQWTVWDVTFRNGRHHRHAHADPRAAERCFVSESGMRRAYKFSASDSRVLDPQALQRQLASATYLPTQPPDLSALSLSEGERRVPKF